MESFFTRYRNLVVLLAVLRGADHRAGRAGAPDRGRARQPRCAATARACASSATGRNRWSRPPETVHSRLQAGCRPVVRAISTCATSGSRTWNLKQTVDRLRLEQAELLEDAVRAAAAGIARFSGEIYLRDRAGAGHSAPAAAISPRFFISTRARTRRVEARYGRHFRRWHRRQGARQFSTLPRCWPSTTGPAAQA